MEGYINNDTLIEDEIVKLFKSSVICTLCKSILVNPIMCMKCQNVYCKKCIDNWNEQNKNCPNKCDSPTYQNCVGKNDILSKLKFNCVGCGKEILYNDAEKHHESCCPGRTSLNLKEIKKINIKPPNIRRIKPEEVEEFKKKGKEIGYMTSN